MGRKVYECRIRTLKDTEAAYLAGIIDGEGTVGLYQGFRKSGRPYKIVLVSVSNTDETLMAWLVSIGGGFVARDKSKSRKPHWKPSFTWAVQAHVDVLGLLKQTLPYLVIKKSRAEMIIDYLEGKP